MKNFTAQNPADPFHIRFTPIPLLMKLNTSVMTCLLALGLTATVRAQDIKLNIPGGTTPPASTAPAATPAAPAAAAPAAPAPVYTEAQLLEEYGWFIGKRVGLSDLNFSQAQIEAVLKGMTAASFGKPSPHELEKIGPKMDEFVKAKQAEYLAKLKAKSLADGAALLTEVKKKKGVTVLPDGLCYEIFEPGTGPGPKPTDTVTVHYIGQLVNGTVFDSSIERQEPIVLPLSQMIPGWVEGLQKIGKGGKIRLYIPPDLAFGDDTRPGIPPSSTLIFDVTILDFKPTPAAPAAPADTATPPPEAPAAQPGK
jgi:FKBP-type peptidyl-prolyl cis-trans isomerase